MKSRGGHRADSENPCSTVNSCSSEMGFSRTASKTASCSLSNMISAVIATTRTLFHAGFRRIIYTSSEPFISGIRKSVKITSDQLFRVQSDAHVVDAN